MSALPPKPVADRDTQPFWDAASQDRLVVPRCRACGTWIWQPRPLCPKCGAGDPKWTEVSGAGRVASWTVVHPPVLPVWAEAVPFVVLLVELAEGVRMLGQLCDERGGLLNTDAGIAIGRPVRLCWRTDEGRTRLPAWTAS